MSTPTPRTDAVYLEHRYWANEDEATEAIEDLRNLARKLERELAIETERATHYRDQWQRVTAELATEREKVRALQEAMKFSANKDKYFQAQFYPCQRASAALAATEETK